MPTYVEIAVNVPRLSDVFHYHLPPELEGQVNTGHLVEVPFGKQRVQGVVLREVSQPAVKETRPVLSLLDTQVVLTRFQLELAEYLSVSTLAPLAACINLMVPVGLSQQADTLYTLKPLEGEAERSADAPTWNDILQDLSPLQRRLAELLHKRGSLRGRQVSKAVPRRNWQSAMHALVRRDLVTTQSVLPPPAVQPKQVRTAQLACPPAVARTELPNLGSSGSKALKRRQTMLRFLMREPGPVNVSWVYAESSGNLSDLRKLADMGLVILGENEVWRDPLEDIDPIPTEPLLLTRDQEAAWQEIKQAFKRLADGQQVPPFLLHGVTGSGKTEIYLQAVEHALQRGEQAIVLVPEIALTPQTVRRFLSRFPGQVGLVHSRLSTGERYDTWRRARLGQLGLVVGPRSALFTPFPNLGLIVVDESHDGSYYQSETLPYYNARQAAVDYARITRAVCMLGSATPDLVSRYYAEQGRWRYLHLPDRILAHRQTVQAQLKRIAPHPTFASKYRPLEKQAQFTDLPPVQVVDMRQELKGGNLSIFSRAMQSSLAEVLANDQQAILFLNRRGHATYVFCRDCGHSLKCPRCDIPLTYHVYERTSSGTGSRSALTCHHCNYQRKMPKTCPHCGGTRIRQYGTGTERVESEVQALFPDARTLRWDYETTRQKGAHDLILSHFANQRADLLIGTQMLAKGLDLPFVTLVGVVLADVSLNLPDYRTPERTFQLLTQVAGRAGRSPLGGKVVLQTFDPQNYIIQTAAQHDYAAFYRQELGYRRQLGYPPFTQLVRMEYRHSQNAQAQAAAQEMAAHINTWLNDQDYRATRMIGPVPCYFARIADQFRWQIILRGPDPASLLRDRALGDWRVEINPISLL